MTFRLCVALFCLLLIGETAHAAATAAPCAQLKSRPEAWLTANVNALVLAAHAAFEKDEAAPAYEKLLNRINGTIQRCKLAQDENFMSRHRAFVEYIAAVSVVQQPDHELGLSVPDKQYFEETRPYVQIPEFLTTQEFLRVVSRTETLERAKTYLRQLNAKRDESEQLIFFSYTSRHLGTPDNDDSYRRLLIVVPGKADEGIPEKWVQFGVTDPATRVRTRNVSVVSALLNSDGTSNIYFKDFYRTYRTGNPITINGRWELGFGDDSCVVCHKSGILPIFPVAGSVRPSEQEAVDAVNRRFLSYGSPSFEKYLDTSKFGPGLSSASADSRERRFGAGFNETAIGRAMSCSACHKQARLGNFNWPMDAVLISSYVKGGQMPRGYTLHASERNELYRKLMQEYFSIDAASPGILKSWLLGQTP